MAKYGLRFYGEHQLPQTLDFDKYALLNRVLKEIKRYFVNIFLFLITKVTATKNNMAIR